MDKVKITPGNKLKIIKWVETHKLEFSVLILILLVGAFLRLYRISDYMTFLGDEGRDVILVRRLLVNFDPILIGPGTSIGNMYLGPLYYYLMAPALFVSNLSPVGPAVQIAVLGIITIFLVWWVAREWFGPVAAVIASMLYAISPVVITYSRSSWNPNIMPFFSLLSVYGIWRLWKYRELLWIVVAGGAFAFVLQSHYLGLLLAPILGIFWLLTALAIRSEQQELKKFTHFSLIACLLFAFLMSPLVIFDMRHGWNNFHAMQQFFTYRQETVSIKPWSSIPKIWPLFEQITTRLIVATNITYGLWLSICMALGGAWLLVRQRHKFFNSPLFFLLTWIGFGLVGSALYKQNIYDHYFGFMFAAPFLLLGAIAEEALKVSKLIVVLLVLWLAWINIQSTPIKYSPQGQLQRTRGVAEKIVQESGEKPLNLAVLAERNYEDAYQYFLEWWRKPIKEIDPARYQETIADQLFVVCELPSEKCDPTHSSKAEVTEFGWSKIEDEWDVSGVKLYKLVHNPTGMPQ